MTSEQWGEWARQLFGLDEEDAQTDEELTKLITEFCEKDWNDIRILEARLQRCVDALKSISREASKHADIEVSTSLG